MVYTFVHNCSYTSIQLAQIHYDAEKYLAIADYTILQAC